MDPWAAVIRRNCMGQRGRPFVARDVIARGELTPYELRKDHVAVFRGVYVRRGTAMSLMVRTRAAVLACGGDATIVGFAAAALHRSKWIDDAIPIEINRSERRAPAGIVVRSETLADDELCRVDGLPTTTPARTAFDLGRWLGIDSAVEAVDALMNASGLDSSDVERVVVAHRRARGLRRLREVLSLVDGGSESPPESRTRLLLSRSGLPIPETQIEIFDEYGHAHIRLDMGWRRWKVAVEYDGEQHWTSRRQRSRDIDRSAELEALGWRVVRVSAELLAARPDVVVARVVAALRRSGCPNV